MRTMTCLAVFFLTFLLILNDCLAIYQMESNYSDYGRWFAWSSDNLYDRTKLLVKSGEVLSGSRLYLTHPVSSEENDLAAIVSVDSDGSERRVKPQIKDDEGNWLPPESHITVEDEGAARATEFIVGSFTAEFAEHNGIELYEGRFPQTNGEIAVELAVLRKLGLSYELGQDVTFYVADAVETADEPSWVSYDDEDMNIELSLVSFKLVGTIKRYTSKWNNAAYNLPSAVITNDDAASLDMNIRTIAFYDIADDLKTSAVWDASSDLKKVLESMVEAAETETPSVAVRTINTNAYDNPLWGSSALFKGMTWLLAAASVSILAYLTALYLGKRKPYFMRIRELGASVSDVIRLAGGECLYSVAPVAFATIAAAYAVSIAAIALFSLLTGMRFFFTFRFSTFSMVLAVTAGTVIAALTAALIIFAGRGITEKKRTLSRLASKHIKKQALRKYKNAYLGLFETLKRARIIKRVRTTAIRVICILVSAMILFCFMTVYSKVRSYYIVKLKEPDFVGDYFNWEHGYGGTVMTVHIPEHSERVGNHLKKVDTAELKFNGGQYYSAEYGLDSGFFDELNEIPGIKSVTKDLFSADYHASWDDIEDDGFFNYCINLTAERLVEANKINTEKTDMTELKAHIANTYWRLLCYSDAEEVWKLAQKSLPKSADREAFIRGEQVIIAVDITGYAASENAIGSSPDYMTMVEYWQVGENLYEKLGSTLDPGDKIRIEKTESGSSPAAEATAAGVIPMQELDLDGAFKLGTLGLEQRLISIIGSSEFAKRLLEADGKPFISNYFTVEVDLNGESENTAKYLSMLCARYGVDYLDFTESQREDREALKETAATYGMFGLILTVLLLFVLETFAAEDRASLNKSINLLSRLGASNKAMKREKRMDSARQSLWLVLSIPVYLVLYAVSFIHHNAPGLLSGSAEAKNTFIKLIADKKLLFERMTWDGMLNIVPIVLIILLLLLGYWSINSRISASEERLDRIHLKGNTV